MVLTRAKHEKRRSFADAAKTAKVFRPAKRIADLDTPRPQALRCRGLDTGHRLRVDCARQQNSRDGSRATPSPPASARPSISFSAPPHQIDKVGLQLVINGPDRHPDIGFTGGDPEGRLANPRMRKGDQRMPRPCDPASPAAPAARLDQPCHHRRRAQPRPRAGPHATVRPESRTASPSEAKVNGPDRTPTASQRQPGQVVKREGDNPGLIPLEARIGDHVRGTRPRFPPPAGTAAPRGRAPAAWRPAASARPHRIAMCPSWPHRCPLPSISERQPKLRDLGDRQPVQLTPEQEPSGPRRHCHRPPPLRALPSSVRISSGLVALRVRRQSGQRSVAFFARKLRPAVQGVAQNGDQFRHGGRPSQQGRSKLTALPVSCQDS
jgi:hypothetical protein